MYLLNSATARPTFCQSFGASEDVNTCAGIKMARTIFASTVQSALL